MANPTTYFGWVMPNSADLVTDLPADFNVFGQGVDTSMQYLLGGTTGQVLSKTSGTNMAFTWINNDQGDITGVTAGTGISVASPTGPVPTVSIDTAVTADLTTAQTLTNKKLSDSTTTIVDVTDATKAIKFDVAGTTGITGTIATAFTTAKTVTIPDTTGTVALTNGVVNNTLTTTTGDIIYASAANTPARLGIGSASQVLSVSGGIPAWTTPASGTTFAGARIYGTSNQTISNATWTNVTFDSETFDTDAFHSTVTNTNRITIPSGKAGYYYVQAWAMFSQNTTGARIMGIFKNGTGGTVDGENVTFMKPDDVDYNTFSSSTTVYLAVTDFVTLTVFQSSGGNLTLQKDATYRSTLIASYLGA